MKNSEALYLAQIAVVQTPTISPEKKLEVLRVLIAEENLALYTESKLGSVPTENTTEI